MAQLKSTKIKSFATIRGSAVLSVSDTAIKKSSSAISGSSFISGYDYFLGLMK